MGHHGRGHGWGFGFHPFASMFCCDTPTKEETITFLEMARKRLDKSIDRLDDKIAKMKEESSESDS